MSTWLLAARLTLQSTRVALARPGATRLLVAALIVAVASVVAVTRITDRVGAAVIAQAGQTLGADLKIELNDPPSPEQRALLTDPAITTAATTSLTTALARGDRLLRASLSAVPRRYPLSGALTITDASGEQREVTHGPASGHVWVASAVLARLHLAVGDTLTVGQSQLQISARLDAEPGGGGRVFDTAPRVLINADDLAATGLAGPTARLDHALLVNAPAGQRAELREQLAATLAPGESIVDPASANRGLASAMDKAGVFLNLAALSAVILAAVAVTLSALRHGAAQRETIALYKTLGGARGVIRRVLAGQLLLLGSLGLVIGWLIGELAQAGLAGIVARLFEVALPGGQLTAAWPAAGVVAVLLAGFAWPALAGVLATPPARILAGSVNTPRRRRWPAYGTAFAALAIMAGAATGDWRLALWVLGGLGGAALVFAAVVVSLLAGLSRVRRALDGRLPPALRLGLDGLLRRRGPTLIQSVALGLGLTVVFVLVIVRGDLLAGWQAQVADNAPNRFVINIEADQRGPIRDFLTRRDIPAPVFYPIVRARLAAINDARLADSPAALERAGRLAERAINLSWAGSLKADNTLTEGAWWPELGARDANAPAAMSIADTVARRLDIGLGDRLGFDIAGQSLTGEVTSIRHIDWSSLQPNFFVLFAPAALSDFGASWITSFYVAPGAEATMAGLVERFPNLNVIDIGALLDRLERLISRVSLAVELVFGFTLAAGLVVLLAAMSIHRDARRREAAVLRALGATSHQLRRAAWAECVIIGALAALPAAAAGQIAARLIAEYALHVDYHARPGIWLIGVAVAVAGIAATGVAALGDVRRQPAWRALRDSKT